MTTLEERFRKGEEIRARLGGGRPGGGSVPASRDLAPDLQYITNECLFGSIWTRPGLDIKYRSIATISALTALQRERQLRGHISNGLNLGLTPQEIIEIFMQLVFYVGAPACLNAMALAQEVFHERGIRFKPLRAYNPKEDPEVLYQRGLQKHLEVMGDVTGYYTWPPTEEEKELDHLTNEYLWGAIWTRPGLDLKSRTICTLSALTVAGRYDQNLRRHIIAALRVGLSQKEVMEVLIQTGFYGGFPTARMAMQIAKSVFRELEGQRAP